RTRSRVGNIRQTAATQTFPNVPIAVVCSPHVAALHHTRTGCHTRERGCAAVTPNTTTRPRGGIRRKLLGLPALFLLATVVGTASLAGLAGASSPMSADGKFNAATWKPTLDAPLPPMEAPLSFHLSDQPAYWYDNGRTDLEGILHSRSLSAAVAGVPTKVKFDIGEPYTSQTHTVSSIVWPVGAKGVPFIQQGSFA